MLTNSFESLSEMRTFSLKNALSQCHLCFFRVECLKKFTELVIDSVFIQAQTVVYPFLVRPGFHIS